MTTYHVFGNPVECADCHNQVSAVWANSQEEAVQGLGQCEECRLAKVNPDCTTSGADEVQIDETNLVPPSFGRRKLTDG